MKTCESILILFYFQIKDQPDKVDRLWKLQLRPDDRGKSERQRARDQR